jgi:hypothetical protein
LAFAIGTDDVESSQVQVIVKFRLDGKCFVWFGAAANRCAIYGVVGDNKDDLKDYDVSKGTIRF